MMHEMIFMVIHLKSYEFVWNSSEKSQMRGKLPYECISGQALEIGEEIYKKTATQKTKKKIFTLHNTPERKYQIKCVRQGLSLWGNTM